MESNTAIEKPSFTFQWRIENFDQFWERDDDSIYSPLFLAVALDQTDWYLLLCPKRTYSENCSLYLSRGEGGPDDNITIDYELSIVSVDECPHVIAKCTDTFEKRTLNGIHDYLSHEELFLTRRSSFICKDTLTIRCRMWKQNADLKEDVVCFGYSRVGVDKRSFVWEIKELSKLQLGERKATKILSPSLISNPVIIRVSLEGASLADAVVRIQMGQEDSDKKGLLSCKISVLTRSGKVYDSMKDKYWLARLQGGSFWNFPKFIKREELIDRARDLLPEDKLILKFELAISVGVEYETIEKIQYAPVPEDYNYDTIGRKNLPDTHHCYTEFVPQSYLQQNLLILYKEQILSDFELRTDNVSFPVHKNILSVRSPVFKAMFVSGMAEVTTSYIDIPDVTSDTLDKMLTFIYAGIVKPLSWESATELYYAADKYQIPSLKQRCASFFKAKIEFSNVCDILILADRHQDDDLKSFIHRFLLKHHDKIFLTEQWKVFMDKHLRLAADTMHTMFKKLDINVINHMDY